MDRTGQEGKKNGENRIRRLERGIEQDKKVGRTDRTG